MPDAKFVPLHIGGEERPSSDNTTYEVRNPSNGELLFNAAAATAEDCKLAVETAAKAFETWQHATPGVRSSIIRKAADLVRSEKYKQRIIDTVVQETGSAPVWADMSNVLLGSMYMDAGVDLPYQVRGEIIPSDYGNQVFVKKRPMGVIFIISPWNAPVGLGFITTLPALAAGNTLVFKTSEFSPGSQSLIAEIFKEAGLPDGVFNLIHTTREDAGARVAEIIAHPLVRKLGFTGSDRVGKILAAELAKHLKPGVFELGGKAPTIVLKDANINSAARAAVAGSMLHCGQLCISTERVIVQKEVSDQLIRRIKEIASNLKVGDPSKKETKLGPVFSTGSAANIVGMIKEAVDAGAEVLVGDLKHDGAFVQPHVILGAKPGDRLWERETFGPVMTIAVADSVEHAIELANASTYSLTSSIWTSNMQTAFDVASKIRAGKTIVNGLTFGTETRFNQAGLGGSSGYGHFSLEEFLDTQMIAFENPEQPFILVDF